MGETMPEVRTLTLLMPFSILERIDVGETWRGVARLQASAAAFSILERIDVGETSLVWASSARAWGFQYPRTDRRG